MADSIIRAYATAHGNVEYTFRNYPFNSACNTYLKEERFPKACRAATAAEAAARL